MINAIKITVFGLVQGVGFRFYVKNKANSLNLTGWVQNNPDGTVEAQAFGPISKLEQIMHYIKAGSVGSRVDKVEFQWFQTEKAEKTFEIRG